MKNRAVNQNRIFFLDELRGFAVFCMVFYHGFYILGDFFEYEWADKLYYFFMPVQPLFASLFIFICGVSCSLSKSNVKRGLILLGISAGVTLFTAFIIPQFGLTGMEIYFGILHMLAFCVLFFVLFEKVIRKIPCAAGVIICAVLYAFTADIGRGVLAYGNLVEITLPQSVFDTNIFAPLGISNSDFYSADYFPIFPDIFVFLSGVFAGIYFKKVAFPAWTYKSRAAFFGFLGRHTLVIYAAHMPLVFGVTVAVEALINLFR